MSPKWFIGIMLLWLILAFGATAIEQQYLLAGEQSTFQLLMSGNILEKWDALNTFLWWDFPMFHGEMNILRYVLIAISGSVLISILLGIGTQITSVVRRFTGGVG